MSAARSSAVRLPSTFTPAEQPRPSTAPPRPRLRVVRAPAQARTRVPFVVLCMSVLGASL
ncbi:MAG: hypothetical protein HGA44_13880, partial [Cellulomonadaceae bacterium]|nr:hypothetical protein [Cellulomonadaceae bacterium]